MARKVVRQSSDGQGGQADKATGPSSLDSALLFGTDDARTNETSVASDGRNSGAQGAELKVGDGLFRPGGDQGPVAGLQTNAGAQDAPRVVTPVGQGKPVETRVPGVASTIAAESVRNDGQVLTGTTSKTPTGSAPAPSGELNRGSAPNADARTNLPGGKVSLPPLAVLVRALWRRKLRLRRHRAVVAGGANFKTDGSEVRGTTGDTAVARGAQTGTAQNEVGRQLSVETKSVSPGDGKSTQGEIKPVSVAGLSEGTAQPQGDRGTKTQAPSGLGVTLETEKGTNVPTEKGSNVSTDNGVPVDKGVRAEKGGSTKLPQFPWTPSRQTDRADVDQPCANAHAERTGDECFDRWYSTFKGN